MKLEVFLFTILLITVLSVSTGTVFGDQLPVSQEKQVHVKSNFNSGNFTNGFTTQDINKVLDKFKTSFVAGDINSFISIFDVNVQTEDGETREVLEKEYSVLFNTTDKRKIKLNNAIWQEDNYGVISGDIDFVLIIRSRIDGKISRFTGMMRFFFKKHNEALIISRFFHAYDNNTAL